MAWVFTDEGDFDVYDIPDALNPEVPADPSVFLNGILNLHIIRTQFLTSNLS
jgi:hypothetical protein